jgi:lysozyme family protein
MFYCNECAEKTGWPEVLAKSKGNCEICKKTAICNDHPLSKLPKRKDKMTWIGFKDAFEKTMKHEGGYVNDEDDAGMETYMGISKRYHPGWIGWLYVDGYKNKSKTQLSARLANDETLQEIVKDFYKENYWDTWRGDDFTDQNLANEMFDIAVNMGVIRASMFLQRSLNLLNRGQILFKNLVVDGKVGVKTMRALARIKQKGDVKYVIKLLNIFQGMHYIRYMEKSPIQEKYARGWLNRVTIEK